MSEQKGLSRRKFLVGAGVATGALAVAGVGAATAEAAYTAFPWPYVTLTDTDIAAVRQTAYNNYFSGGCMYATASALIGKLFEKAGAPWDTIPQDLFKYGAGGVQSWGTVCGALNGACWVIQATAGSNAGNVITDLFGWYCNNPFPSKLQDAYAHYPNQATTVSKSPLCHCSSTTWAHTLGFRINGYERKDRCAKLAADVAAKTIEYLNAVKAGTYRYSWAADEETAKCMGCHVGASSQLDDVQAKATCKDWCHHGH